MPELPEVEILKHQLVVLEGKIINNVFFSGKKLKFMYNFKEKDIKNEEILKLYRRNKYLILQTNKYWLLIHLGMTGQVILNVEEQKKHEHFKITFKDGTTLSYIDPRRFGLIMAYKRTEYLEYCALDLLKNLGIEPLSKEFTLKKYIEIFNINKTKNLTMKQFLMDNQYVCGIGNIYANEILFMSKISPTKKINTINIKKYESIYQNILTILNKAILLGGSSISDFKHTNGLSGSMQNFYNVYGRDGENCKVCNNNIFRIKQNGRSSFYCKKCQK